MPVKFNAVLGSDDPGSLFVEVPARIMAELGNRKRIPLLVTINWVQYSSTSAVYGGRYYLPVRKEIRNRAKVAAGMQVSVELEWDETERIVEVPPALAAALAANPAAGAAFNRQSFSHRKEMAHSITSAKHEETRQRRLEKILSSLGA